MAFTKLHGLPSIQGFDPSSIELFSFKSHNSSMLEGGGFSESHLTLYDPCNLSSNCFTFGQINYASTETQSITNETVSACSSQPMLNFEHGEHTLRVNHCHYDSINDGEEECTSWIKAVGGRYQLDRVIEDQNCFEMANGYGYMSDRIKDDHYREVGFALLRPTTTTVDVTVNRKRGAQESALQKRHYTEVDAQASKKQCSNSRKTKSMPPLDKDPQSIAAKNRRERISERLKILQELVPNGTKVDLVTMLEKAISYVKFLQLQVKVLATDEFWPSQGGKAPEVAQVKEAIDAILSSYKNRNSKQ